MRICRFTALRDAPAGPRLGILDDRGVRDVTAVTEGLPALRWPLPPGDQLIANLDRLRPRMEALAADAPVIPREAVRLLSPVANPRNLICGLGNWKHHGAPLGMLGFIAKAPGALAGADDGVQLRWPDRTTVHEAELAWVIGRECTNLSVAEAAAAIAGYTCGLDMTLEKENEDYSFCKSFDTYGMLGPALVTSDEVGDPSKLAYTFAINGEAKHARGFDQLTASPAELTAYISTMMTLYPGDVIYSGTAEVGPVVPGDLMTLEIPRVGRLEVPVTASPHARQPRIAAAEPAE
jgi:2-keto-4-pentenoate hydratase/2-oxohepta-3-ene-1,7-dioic acid hydratase in catechol pathway